MTILLLSIIALLLYLYLIPGMWSLMCFVDSSTGHEPDWDEYKWFAYFWPFFVAVMICIIAGVLLFAPFELLSGGRSSLEDWKKKDNK